MNGKLQGIIVCVIVLLCLGGALIFLNKTGKSGNESSTSESAASSEADESVKIIDSSADEIKSVKISNKSGEFTVEKPASGKTSWDIKELKGLNQSTSMKSTMADNAAQLEAKKLVDDNAEDLTKYGLDKPEATFTITFSDNSTKTICVGNNLPESSKYRYVMEKGIKKVYSVLDTRMQYFTDSKESYLDTTLIVKPDEEGGYGKLTITRDNLDYDMTFVQDSDNTNDMMSAQVMTSPINSYLNGTTSTDTTHGLWGLTAEKGVCIFPTKEDFKKYGLDKPHTTVVYNGSGVNYKLTVGNPVYSKDSEGNDNSSVAYYYCYVEGVSGIDCIWMVSSESLPWVTVKPEDIISTIMTYNNIANVNEIDVDYKNQITKYTLTSKDEDVKTAKINGKDTDVDNFKTFYQYMLSCPTSEIWLKDPEGESFLTIKIKSGDKTDTLEFFEDSSSARKAVIKRNGKTSFRVSLNWTDKFVKNMELLAEGKQVAASY